MDLMTISTKDFTLFCFLFDFFHRETRCDHSSNVSFLVSFVMKLKGTMIIKTAMITLQGFLPFNVIFTKRCLSLPYYYFLANFTFTSVVAFPIYNTSGVVFCQWFFDATLRASFHWFVSFVNIYIIYKFQNRCSIQLS